MCATKHKALKWRYKNDKVGATEEEMKHIFTIRKNKERDGLTN